ncbi:MAG TPA: glutathione S-transferase N-terminal domain-containing protein [Kofleriaceae bacterium]
MIDAYTWTTPNGQKLVIALEELGVPYKLHWIDISKDEQKTPEFLAINPNHKIPAIVDRDGPGAKPLAVFESGAVLLYLADKTGKLLAREGAARYAALEWMFFNIGNTGPITGQLGFFGKRAPEKVPMAIEHFKTEVERLHGVLDTRLGQARYLAGDAYTMADIINVTWVLAAEKAELGLEPRKKKNLGRWLDEVTARPAVKKGLEAKP